MKHLHYLLAILALLGACKDIEMEPIDRDGTAPNPITEVTVTPIAGGANISYQLPTDPDLLYVEASYTLSNGEKTRINSSFNRRNIKVEGFAEEKENQITLTCVDRSGNYSTPYVVRFIPGTPPVKSTFNTLKVRPDFGGINITWENSTATELAILVYQKDSIGDDVNIDTYYTSLKNGSYSIRGLDTIPSEFSIKLRDKWNNYSPVKREVVTPIYETKLDRKKFKSLGAEYASSVKDPHNIPQLWDANRDNNFLGDANIPWHISFDTGAPLVRLSRVVMWQYAWPFNNYGHLYAGGNGKLFEIWGTSDAIPTTDMSGWTLIRTCEIVKPSGLPSAIGRENMSNEDFDLARNKGHEFSIPLEAPAIRYIRLRSLEGFGGSLAVYSELELYGNPNAKK